MTVTGYQWAHLLLKCYLAKQLETVKLPGLWLVQHMRVPFAASCLHVFCVIKMSVQVCMVVLPIALWLVSSVLRICGACFFSFHF